VSKYTCNHKGAKGQQMGCCFYISEERGMASLRPWGCVSEAEMESREGTSEGRALGSAF
jgi:hypothetical protein